MGQDLYHMSRDIALQSQPRLVALLQRIREQLLADEIGGWEPLVAEIDRELTNATIR